MGARGPRGAVTVSVVIPARDAAATLPLLLRALRAQTATVLEVVVVDDGSRDDTAAVAASLGATVVRMDRNRGPGPARNAGVAQSRGAVIAFTDADCVPPPDWIARSLAFMARHAARVTTSGYLGPVDGDVASWFQHWEKRAREPFAPLEICATNGHSLAIERALYLEAGGMPDLRTSEDFLFGRKLARITAVRFDPDNGVLHRFRPGLAGYLRQKVLFAQNSVRAAHAVPRAPTRLATFSPPRVAAELATTATGLALLAAGAWHPTAALGACALLGLRALPFLVFLARRRGADRAQVPPWLFVGSPALLVLRDVATMVGVARGLVLVRFGEPVRVDPMRDDHDGGSTQAGYGSS